MGSLGGGEVVSKKKKAAMWLYPKVMGFNPPERWGHSACYSNGYLYVFGGCCGGLHFSDVLVLNLESMAWNNLVTTGQGPGPRDSHSAVLVAHMMLVFGGTNGSKKVSDLHILDLRSREWVRPICKGVAPSPRESHTTTLVGDDKLVVFGGSGEGGVNYLNDLHILDLKTMCWTSPQVKGDIPVPRDSHSAVAIQNKVFVYGGDCGDRYQGDVDIFDMDTFTWSRLAVLGPSPGVRAGHAAVSVGTKVYIIGGVGDKKYYNDVWVLDTINCSWNQLEIRGQQPQGRFSHTAIVADSDIAIYGGCGADERPLNEVLILQLGAEHPNGRYNISICKIFGSHCNQEKRKPFQEQDQLNKKTMLSGSCVENARNSNRETELQTKQTFQFTSDAMNSKRKRMNNSKTCEIESEPEEHSLSLSQHSSPSHSDQEQTPAKKATSSATPAQVFPLFRQQQQQQQSQVSSNSKNAASPITIAQKGPQDLRFMGEHLNQAKPEQIHVHRMGRHDMQYPLETQKQFEPRHFQNMIGADIHGNVDGAFDSGYLMTATVNGRIFRGVLFSPGPEACTRGSIVGQNHSSPTSHNIAQSNPHINHTLIRQFQQPTSTQHPPEPTHNNNPSYPQQHVQVRRRSTAVIRTAAPSAGRDSKLRSELEGVVLTLGGPSS